MSYQLSRFCAAILCGQTAALKFFRTRRPNMRYQPFLARSKTAIICSPLCQAHVVWGNDAHRIGILVILSVVLPEAHRANVVPTSFFECFVVAAGASIAHPPPRRGKHRPVAQVGILNGQSYPRMKLEPRFQRFMERRQELPLYQKNYRRATVFGKWSIRIATFSRPRTRRR